MLRVRRAAAVPKDQQLVAPAEGLSDEVDGHNERVDIFLEESPFRVDALVKSFVDRVFHSPLADR